jgi:hypothetical protein
MTMTSLYNVKKPENIHQKEERAYRKHNHDEAFMLPDLFFNMLFHI